ncbi:MAG: (d)CMP kinase [Bacteroidales bacterium]|nr:(d)CMP kinase [Bacteroidales bacterium]
MNNQHNIIIAIDGYSSSGKSTLAKAIAKHLGYKYIDSGAMYRAITLFALQNNLVDIPKHRVNEEKLKSLMDQVVINFRFNAEKNRQETYLNEKNVEDEIRKMKVSNAVSLVSKLKFVRQKMVRIQQDMGKEKGIVMDGRDIGTVVFPDAEIKIFMTAKPEVRAKRRYQELVENKVNVSYEEILENVKKRDHLDETRKESPLKKASDAIELDNSQLTEKEQLKWVLRLIQERMKQMD